MKFTTEQDEVLIDLVRSYPILYSVKRKSYKDNEAKENAWKIIAAKMDKNEIDCRNRWKNIKDYYQRKKKGVTKGTGSAADGDDFYQKFKSLLFLENTAFVERSSKSNILHTPSSPDLTQEASDVLDESTEHELNENIIGTQSEQSESSQLLQQSQSEEIQNKNRSEPNNFIRENVPRNSETVKNNAAPTPKQTKRNRSRPDGDSCIEELKRGRYERTAMLKELFSNNDTALKRDPAIAMFFYSIAVTVASFTPTMKAKAKAEVMTLISKLELENIQQIEQAQQTYTYAHGDSSHSLPQGRNNSSLDSPGTSDSMAFSVDSSHSLPPERYTISSLDSPGNTRDSMAFSINSPHALPSERYTITNLDCSGTTCASNIMNNRIQ